jgi:nucleoside-diphosphate-sugar epimerase
MATRKTAFVSGGTGFLGSFLINFLLRQGCRVIALVRGPEAEGRLVETLQEITGNADDSPFKNGDLVVLEGDVRKPGLGLTEAQLAAVATRVDEIWHCAASFKFQERYREEIAAHNITGTRHMLDFARRCNQRATTPIFYVSTAYAAPLVDGLVRETLPTADTPFRNRYEWSKQEAERLVGAYREQFDLPAVIFRPSIIIGHSQTGRAVRFTGYYDVIRAIYLLTQSLAINLGAHFDRNLHLRILAGPAVRLNVVPVDFVIAAMWRLSRSERRGAWIFNITNEHPPLLDDLFAHACAPLAVTGITLVTESDFQQRPMSGLERIFNRKTQFQTPYLLDGPRFDDRNFRALVPETTLPCPSANAELMRRVNEFYYQEVLDRQFRAPRQPLSSVTSETFVTAAGPENTWFATV